MARIPTGETPFHLMFGSEAIILTELGLASYRIAHHNEERKEEGICLHLDVLDEVRATAEQWMVYCYKGGTYHLETLTEKG